MTRPADSSALQREEGTLVSIVYRSPTGPWGLATFRRTDGTAFTACGDFGNSVLFEEFVLYGQRVPDLPGGDFEVAQFTSQPPSQLANIPGYLASLTGASRSGTGQLVKTFGEHTIEIIERTPDRLTEADIPQRDIELLLSGWRTLRSDRLALAKIELEGIPLYKLSKLQRVYGNQADLNNLLKSDPYCLYLHFEDIPFSTALSLASRLGISNESEAAIRGGVIAALRREAWFGHSIMHHTELTESVSRLLRIAPGAVRALLRPAVTEIRRLGLVRIDGPHIQLMKLHSAETALFSVIESWSSRVEADLENDLVPSPDMGMQLLKPMRLKQAATGQLLAGVSSLLAECFAIVQCQTFDDQIHVGKALGHILKAYDANAVAVTYTLEMLNDLSGSLGELIPATTYADLLGLDTETGFPERHAGNPIPAEAVIVFGADALGIEEMLQLLQAVPATARLYLLGCPQDLPTLSIGQPFADMIEDTRIKAFHASFWGVADAAPHRQAQELIWSGALAAADEFDPTQPISWVRCDPSLIPNLLPELLKEFAESVGVDPLADVRIAAPAAGHEVIRKSVEALTRFFAASDAPPVSFQGRHYHQGVPVVLRQPIASIQTPAFCVFHPTHVTASALTLRASNGSEVTIPAEQKVDVFDALVMPPKFIRGRRYKFVVLLAISEQCGAITNELMSSLLNTAAESLIVIGDIDALTDSMASRPSLRARSRLYLWGQDT